MALRPGDWVQHPDADDAGPDLQTGGLQVIKESFHLSVLFRVDWVRDMNSEKLSANTDKISLTNIMLTVPLWPSAQYGSDIIKYPSRDLTAHQTRA